MLAYTFYETDGRVMRYAEALVKEGVSVDAIVLRKPGQSKKEIISGVTVFRVQERQLNETGKFSYLYRILLFLVISATKVSYEDFKKKYDFIHVHSIPDFEIFATLLPKMRGAKVVLDIHDIVPEFYAAKFGVAKRSLIFRALLSVERFSASFADHVIIANDLWREKIVRRSVDAAKCTSLINFPDTDIFRSSLRKKNDEKNFVVIYPGTLSWHQGLDIAIEAFALIVDRAPNMRFCIFGEGPARKEIESIVRQKALANRVSLNPELPLREIASVMAGADLGIVPKRDDDFGGEAFSTKILEFMALGVPLVVANTRIDKHYFDEDLLRFFEAGDAKDLARVLLDAYCNPEEGDKRAMEALKYAHAQSWEKMKQEYFRIAESLIRRPITAKVQHEN